MVQANMSPGGGRSQNAAVHVLFCACFSSSRTRSTVFMWPRARFDGNQLLIVDSVFGENLVGLDFLYSVSYINPIPTHEKIFTVQKSGPNATFNLIFLGLSWPWVGEFVGFIITFTCFPAQHSLVYTSQNTLIVRNSHQNNIITVIIIILIIVITIIAIITSGWKFEEGPIGRNDARGRFNWSGSRGR